MRKNVALDMALLNLEEDIRRESGISDRPAPDVCENCGHDPDRHVDIAHDKFRVDRDCHDCDCPGYRPPTTEPAERLRCIECGDEKDPSEITIFRSVIVCIKCSSEPADSEGKCRECGGSLDEVDVEDGTFICVKCFTAPPEDALEDAKAFLKENTALTPTEISLFAPNVQTYAEQYAAKKLAERDKQTTDDLKSLASRVKELEAAIETVLPHFESHQVYDKGSEAILRAALGEKNEN
jgi:hypothetical protein